MWLAAAPQRLGGMAHAYNEGARVSMCSRDADAIGAAASRLNADTGALVLATTCDVRDAASIQHWVDRTVAEWGHIDALFVNAGGPPTGFFREITDEQWQKAFELTLLSSVRTIRAALPHMTTGSAIVVSTSSSVREPIERLGLSTVMRSGVAGLVKTLADELVVDGIA
jgi:3-oxoacyl-[acyl-carrier protein] reductase